MLIVAILVILAALAYAYSRLVKTNMDIPAKAEIPMGPLARLKFALKYDLPVDRRGNMV